MPSIPADTVVLPLATEADAERTCESLVRTVGAGGRAIVVYVVEKAGGAPDKASVEQREEVGEAAFDVAREALGDHDWTVETQVRYDTDVVGAIFDVAREVDADLVAFAPREASRLIRFLSGDDTLDLVTDLDRPVLALPPVEPDAAPADEDDA